MYLRLNMQIHINLAYLTTYSIYRIGIINGDD